MILLEDENADEDDETGLIAYWFLDIKRVELVTSCDFIGFEVSDVPDDVLLIPIGISLDSSALAKCWFVV